MQPVKLVSLVAENTMRLKSIIMQFDQDGVTIIGGRNGVGKTTLLKDIMFALGGASYKPTDYKRDGSEDDPYLKVELSNGWTVERSGKNAALKVTDQNGGKYGQTPLDAFISAFALDLPKFLNSSPKDKSLALLATVNLEKEIAAIETEEKRLEGERVIEGRIVKQAAGHAAGLVSYPEVTEAEPLSSKALVDAQQKILDENRANNQKRAKAENFDGEWRAAHRSTENIREELQCAEQREKELLVLTQSWAKECENLKDGSTEEIETTLANMDETNAKIRANNAKRLANAEAKEHNEAYAKLTKQIEKTRANKMALLDGADLPLPGLTIEDWQLCYNGHKWDCMSGAEQMKVATAIARKINPHCGFVLVDKLEQMDSQTLEEFRAWATAEKLQVIATRVSTGDECSIIIEEGQ